MFFCDSCAAKNHWPDSGYKFNNVVCEVCGATTLCNKVDASYLSPTDPASLLAHTPGRQITHPWRERYNQRHLPITILEGGGGSNPGSNPEAEEKKE